MSLYADAFQQFEHGVQIRSSMNDSYGVHDVLEILCSAPEFLRAPWQAIAQIYGVTDDKPVIAELIGRG